MIQLVRAKFRNFRSLRNVALDFSRDAEKPLTVIRAENASGKTTILTALTWALFGDDALPGRRATFRLHPIDWDEKRDGTEVRIEVEVVFVTVDDETEIETTYELIRSAVETPKADGTFLPQRSNVVLLKHGAAGAQPVDNPTAFISNRILPRSLKDVFFIDGDRALAFIEASDDKAVKRERVESAVRSLLGLDLLESAEGHLDTARREAVQQVKTEAKGTSLGVLTEREDHLKNEILTLEETKKGLLEDSTATEGRKRRADEALRDALAAGGADRKQLEVELTEAQNRLAAERKRYQDLLTRHTTLLSSSTLDYEVAHEAVGRAAELLTNLEREKGIPNTLPSVVQDRLVRGTCICGRDVHPGTEGHEALASILAQSQEITEAQEILMELNSAVRRALRDREDGERWSTRAATEFGEITHCVRLISTEEKRCGELRARVSKIPDKDIAALEAMVSEEEREHYRLGNEVARLSERISNCERELREVSHERTEAQKKESKYALRLAEETAATDLLNVIRGTIETLETATMAEVNEQMQRIFLQMIVADPKEGGVIQRAELTHDRDIVVYGPGGKQLDPDRDLSGAQRRALTLAFILSLIRVSGVRAPNVVDTPLGMMSGAVRRAVLEYASMNSSQLVMFLTNDEIRGVEDILDRFAGHTCTLTHTGHYPRQLQNDPGTGRLETLTCLCDYRSSCAICERIGMIPR